MPKRFVATELWDEDWFLEMPKDYKLFWFYMLSACDHSGIFKVNVRTFCRLHDAVVESDEALKHFNNGKERIKVLSGSVWLIEDFFVFQYGTTFNPNNKVHESIEKLYGKHDLKMTSIRGLKDLKDRAKDKDKDKDKDIKKGGLGENKNNRGVEFEDSETVILESGKKQRLGKSQKIRLQHEDIKAQEIYEGYIT